MIFEKKRFWLGFLQIFFLFVGDTMTLSLATFGRMTFSITTFSIMTFSITKFSITTFSIMALA